MAMVSFMNQDYNKKNMKNKKNKKNLFVRVLHTVYAPCGESAEENKNKSKIK